jgi:hypothetical protein
MPLNGVEEPFFFNDVLEYTKKSGKMVADPSQAPEELFKP